MPRTGISYDDVADAAHALEKAGLTPSIRLIREKLGKGSLSTIAGHKRALDAKQATGPGQALPDPIAKGLLKGAQAFWQELVEAAEAEIASVQAQAEDKLAKANAALEAAREEAASANDGWGAAAARIAELEQTLNERDAALKDAKEQLLARAQDFARLEDVHAALKLERDELKASMTAKQQETTAAIAEGARLNERIEHLAADRAAEKAVFAGTIADLESECASRQEALDQEQSARRTAEAACARVNEQAQTREQELQRLISNLADRDAELRDLSKHHATLEADLMAERRVHEDALAAREQRIENLQTALDTAESKLERYEDEQHRLLKQLLQEHQEESS